MPARRPQLRRPGRARRAPAGVIALLGLGLGASPAAGSGLNVERVRMNPEDDGVHGGFSLGLDFQAGNTNRLDLSTSAAVAWRRGKHVAFLVGDSEYATRTQAIQGEGLDELLDRDSRFINKAQVHLRYNYELFPWLVAEGFAQVERDEFLLLEGRVLFGLGPRFVPFNDGEFSLAFGSDWMLELEVLDPARIVEPLPARTLVHRWSSYASLVYTSERIRMRSTTYVQPRFDLFRDLRLMSEGTLEVTLIEPVSLSLTARLRWDTMPSVTCARAIAIDGCPVAAQIPLREVDVSLENAISVRF